MQRDRKDWEAQQGLEEVWKGLRRVHSVPEERWKEGGK